MGQAFDAAKNDDTFYLPPEVFDNPDFKRGLKLFLSPDGKAARMIITHDGDPATTEGISHIAPIAKAAHEALKGTPMANAGIYLGGTAATYKDIQEGAKYDLMIVAFAALSLILLIMMIITRSLIAALVIVGTVALSLGASFGLSVLVWQYLFGIQLYWVVLALAVILPLAVGSDYNLLLISRSRRRSMPASIPASSGRWPARARWSPRRGSSSPSPCVRSSSAAFRFSVRSGRRSGWACCSTR